MKVEERAQKTRELLETKGWGVLCTHSEMLPGYPSGSMTAFAVDAAGRPVFLLSGLALHTKNLRANAKASLVVTAGDSASAARANVFGDITAIAGEEDAEVRARYLSRHPESAQWVDFGDFSFYVMTVRGAYWVGGFGEMGWVPGEQF